jgi:RNA polymerase sigma-70 factor (ECF subfamily)
MGARPAGHAPPMLPGSSSRPTSAGGRGPAAGGKAGQGDGAEPLSPPQLYDSHFSFVWRSLRRLGIPEALAEDAAQDVFLVVHRRWESYDPKWSSVETWLFGIVLRVARNHRRSLKRRASCLVPSEGKDAVAPTVEADELVARRQAADTLDSLLETLDDDRRALFVLVHIEQMPVPTAAAALGINVNTAYWRLRTARKRLERALARMKARNGWTREEGR